jgi:serine protease Do
MTEVFEPIRDTIGSVAERATPAVVRIGSTWRGASGVIVGEGRVLTNAHNVHAEAPQVTFADGRVAESRVAGLDVDGDIAVLEVDTHGARGLEWAPDDGVGIGTAVIAVSAGSGSSGGPRVTLGFVSSVARDFRGPRGRRIRGSIEHTAPMAPGSSGSALVDAQGRLVGINTNRAGAGFYLAVPTDEALRQRVDSLGRGEEPRRPRLGVSLAPSGVAGRMRQAVGLPDREGVLVRELDTDGPAAGAGIDVGDLIVTAAGRPITSVDDLADVLGSLGGASSLEVGVVRGVEERVVTVQLGPG